MRFGAVTMQIRIPDFAAGVLSGLENAGHEAYAVGGCCRDAVLGREPSDWDICTSALPEEIMSVFPECIPTGIKHGTVTVKTAGGPVEVTTFRIDGGYADHRRPEEVRFTSKLREDLARRDFTMNAMAANLRGELTDPFGGMADISEKHIRCVGDARIRFSEDALRMFRAMRFSAQLGFELDGDILSATRELSSDARYLASERILSETVKTLISPEPEKLAVGLRWGLYDHLLKNHGADVETELSRLRKFPADEKLRLFALGLVLENASWTDSALSFLRAIRAPSSVCRACELSEAFSSVLHGGSIAEAAAAAGRQYAPYAGAAMEIYGTQDACSKMSALLAEERCLAVCELAISGGDIKAQGLSGAEIGRCQKKLLEYVVSHPADNRREILIDLVKTYAAQLL
jgi:tRNA nucleotidyltransferase (CCA-adding enzyme)